MVVHRLMLSFRVLGMVGFKWCRRKMLESAIWFRNPVSKHVITALYAFVSVKVALESVVCLIVHAINIGLNTSNAIPDSYASNGNGKLGFILTHFWDLDMSTCCTCLRQLDVQRDNSKRQLGEVWPFDLYLCASNYQWRSCVALINPENSTDNP